MASTIIESAQDVAKAYGRLTSDGMAALTAWQEQAVCAAQTFSQAARVELDAAGKAMQGATDYARARNAKMSELANSLASAPASGDESGSAGASAKAAEIIDGDAEFIRSWSEYALDLERRRLELVGETLPSNAAAVKAGQAVVKSAFDYGAAVAQWSAALAGTAKSG